MDQHTIEEVREVLRQIEITYDYNQHRWILDELITIKEYLNKGRELNALGRLTALLFHINLLEKK